MKSLVLKIAAAAGVVATLAVPALSADDPVAVRKALMQSLGGAAGIFGGVSKGEIAYSPALGKAAISTANATAHAFGDYFPEGSDMGANSTASPKIWEDMAGFEAAVAKLKEATMAAATASGKDGPADADAFKAAMGPVMGTCKTCHEAFRVSN